MKNERTFEPKQLSDVIKNIEPDLKKRTHDRCTDKNIIILDQGNNNSVEFSKVFKNEYLDVVKHPELLKEPILTTNLLFQIVKDLKSKMFHTNDSYIYDPSDRKNNQMKLEFWEKEVINTDKNELKKVYKASQFLKNRDKKILTKSLDFLKNFKSHIYSFENSDGKVITTSSGLIKDWHFYPKSSTFEIKISLYWANKIVTLEKDKWNILQIDILKQFKDNKQRLFVLWLMSVKKYVGTRKKIDAIIEEYKLNYPNSYELMRGFIEPIKNKLDDKDINDDWLSFNYFPEGENLAFIPYDVNPNKQKWEKDEDKDKAERSKERTLRNAINYQAKYFKSRHECTPDIVKKLRSDFLEKDLVLFKTKYRIFLSKIRKEKKKADDFNGSQVLERISKLE